MESMKRPKTASLPASLIPLSMEDLIEKRGRESAKAGTRLGGARLGTELCPGESCHFGLQFEQSLRKHL